MFFRNLVSFVIVCRLPARSVCSQSVVDEGSQVAYLESDQCLRK